ncbi:MAG: hypothetical protein R3213_09320, partial [Flavobacteriaceae bacterium]|nr:hypothetical protein [Flavobacteriaceae bacterium]
MGVESYSYFEGLEKIKEDLSKNKGKQKLSDVLPDDNVFSDENFYISNFTVEQYLNMRPSAIQLTENGSVKLEAGKLTNIRRNPLTALKGLGGNLICVLPYYDSD